MEDYQQESFSLPSMYGDHHVIRVRQIVAALAGVAEIRASAAQQTLVVKFAPGQLSAERIRAALAEGGFAPGAPAPALAGAAEEKLPIVAAAGQAEVRASKYSPPAAFGACPGLETRYFGYEHPADRK
jgi:copper chaperone CopZ